MDNTALAPRENQSGVLDRLPFNLTQLLAFAMQKPRDAMKAMDNAIAQLRATPQFASKAYYSIPFKKKQADGSYTEEIVEGPSIKAATALTGCWGNNVEGAFIGEETNQYVDVSGYFFDYETGKLTIRPHRISKTFKTKDGKVIEWRKDMLDKQVAAGVSKAIRNADLNGLPAGYVAEYYAEAKRIAAHGGKVGTQSNPTSEAAAISAEMAKIMESFDSIGITQKQLANYVIRHPELSTEESIVAHLIGLWNGIDEGQTTVEEAFSVSEQAPIATPQPAKASKTPPSEGKGRKERVIQPGWRLMNSVMSGGSCEDCGGTIAKGEEMYWDSKARRAHHKVCPK